MNHEVTIKANSSRVMVIKAFVVFLWNLPKDKEFTVLVTVLKKKRTKLQNRSFHKYFEMLSYTLNSAGLDMKKVLKPSVDIPWTAANVKAHLWRPIQEAMFNKESTTQLDTGEVSAVYEVVNKHLGANHGIHVPFPNKEDM